jgi:hypothetical protein
MPDLQQHAAYTDAYKWIIQAAALCFTSTHAATPLHCGNTCASGTAEQAVVVSTYLDHVLSGFPDSKKPQLDFTVACQLGRAS